MLQGFEGVISSRSGTAYQDFQGFPASWNLAGKTGTASNQGPAGQKLEPNSWFVAFGPNPNPQYLVLAVIDQGGYGAQAAAPLVRNIFDYIVANPGDQRRRQDADAGQSGQPDGADDQPAAGDADDHDDHGAEVGHDRRVRARRPPPPTGGG